MTINAQWTFLTHAKFHFLDFSVWIIIWSGIWSLFSHVPAMKSFLKLNLLILPLLARKITKNTLITWLSSKYWFIPIHPVLLMIWIFKSGTFFGHPVWTTQNLDHFQIWTNLSSIKAVGNNLFKAFCWYIYRFVQIQSQLAKSKRTTEQLD